MNWAWKEEGGQTDGTRGSDALGLEEDAARGTLTVPALQDPRPAMVRCCTPRPAASPREG